MPPWLRYLLAFIVFCHGFIYVRIGAVLPGPIKGWTGQSKLLAAIVSDGPLVVLSRFTHVIAGIAILACAVAIAFGHDSWRPLAIAGGTVGILAFAVFWDGQTQLLAQEGVIGVAVSLVLAGCALLL